MKIIKPEFKGKIGFEIECVYKSSNANKVSSVALKNNWRVSGDGSIRTNSEFPFCSEIKFHYDIDELKNNIEEIKKLFEFVESGNKFNCGLHIHVSFDNIQTYYKLCSWKFIDFFQKRYKGYATTEEEKSRIINNYSKFYNSKEDFIFMTNDQLKYPGKNSSRYHAINFNSFNLYKTVEFRIFAGTNSITKFVKNTNFLIETLNEFLKTAKPIDIGIKKKTPEKKGTIIIKKEITKNGEELDEEEKIFQELQSYSSNILGGRN